MYNINGYITDTISLINSTVIKFEDINTVVNRGVLAKGYEVNPDDKTTWKYYMNIAGLKHITNNDVKVNVIETGTVESLTVTLLNNNPVTKKKLLEHSASYKELTSNYVDDIDYIKGCMYPVDIQTAIDARNGTILSIGRQFIGTNELSLIRELESQIQSYISRWHIKEYIITDELYMASFLGTLYANMVNMVMTIRFNKIKTAEVHDFFLEHYFRSRLNLWDDIQVLNKSTIYWLYKNLDKLMKFTGNNYTFDTILVKIFEANNIGVGNYILKPDDSNPLIANTSDTSSSVFTKLDNLIVTEKLNNNYIIDNSTTYNISDLTTLELTNSPGYDTNISAGLVSDYVDLTYNNVKDKHIVTQPTKVLDFNTMKLFKAYGNDAIVNILDHWLYFSSNNKYVIPQTYIDPNTNVVYKLSPIEGFYLLLYMYLSKAGKEQSLLTTIKYTSVVNTDITKDVLTKDLFNQTNNLEIADSILKLVPNTINNILSPDDFYNNYNELKSLYTGVWLYDSNINNATMSSGIKHMVRRIYKSGTHTIDSTGKSIVDVLSTLGITVDTSGSYNTDTSIGELFKTFTGIVVDEFAELDRILNKYINVMLKLSSYTTQVIKSVDDTRVMYLPYSTLEPLHSDVGVITTTDAEILYALDPSYTHIAGSGNDFVDSLKSDYLSKQPTISTCDNELYGIMVADNNQDDFIATITEPNTYIEVLNSCYTLYAPSLITDSFKYDKSLESWHNGLEFIGSSVSADKIGILNNDNQYNEVTATITEPNTYVEVMKNVYSMYSPTVGVSTNSITNRLYSNTNNYNNFNSIKYINNNEVTVYSNYPTKTDIIAVQTEPNTVITIE